MAPLIGKEMVESLFLERFAALCVDPVFHVRKLCAANFGDFCSVVGSEATEKILVYFILKICFDCLTDLFFTFINSCLNFTTSAMTAFGEFGKHVPTFSCQFHVFVLRVSDN